MKLRHPLATATFLLAQTTCAGLALAANAPAPQGNHTNAAGAATTKSPAALGTQPRFESAIAAFAKKQYRNAAADVRAADAIVRKQASRATGDVRRALRDASAGLQRTARALDKGALKSEASLRGAFAKADHALALQDRAEAAASWARKAYKQSGRELAGAANDLERAADWAGGEAKQGAAAAVTATRTLGEKLAAGGTWARDEVAQGFGKLGDALDRLGHGLGVKSKASPFDVGA